MSLQAQKFNLSTLTSKLCIVTGAANNGVGWGICKHAAGVLGMQVVILDLHKQPVSSSAARLREAYPKTQVLGIQCDVTDPAGLEAALKQINEAFPGTQIGAVFANAGVVFYRTMAKSSLEDWTTTFNVNVLGVVNTIKTFLPRMQAENSDAIIATTASIGGLIRGDGGSGPYQSSKHAVVALSESLSFELANRYPGIRVHVICPCIVSSSLRVASQLNQQVSKGMKSSEEVVANEPGTHEFAMTVEHHALQVFDLIAAGKFYVLTDNVRPYVDHDFPFDGISLVKKRMEDMTNLTLDNTAALVADGRPPTATLTGPMFEEMRRKCLQHERYE